MSFLTDEILASTEGIFSCELVSQAVSMLFH